MRDTKYATERVIAEINGNRIERIFVKAENQDEIRFSWWPDGRMATRPLDPPEPQLLELLAEAIRRGVFTEPFLRGLTKLLADRTQPNAATSDAPRS